MHTLHLPFDHSYSRLPALFYERQAPKSWRDPQLVIFNHTLACELGIDTQGVSDKTLAQVFSGQQLPDNALPLAQAYAGHQFGHFAMLGDGRALLVGELLTLQGSRVDVQLKGSGPTPYSRRGDGLAALGPMLREYVVSQAMHALGIPTTRSLAVTTTGERVRRDTTLAGAVLTRVASSHLRVGTFQYAAARQDPEALSQLIDYALQRHAPKLLEAPNRALALLQMVAERQAQLIVQWMRVGFIHGVMNTDNMTISGETIDYGPCAFMDQYDTKTVFSSIDHSGRYSFANQPAMAQWNLARFAEALLSAMDEDADRAIALAEPVVHGFKTQFLSQWQAMMARKIGLAQLRPDDTVLVDDLLTILQADKKDYTHAFVVLGQRVQAWQSEKSLEAVSAAFDDSPAMSAWVNRWRSRLGEEAGGLDAVYAVMQKENPQYIPRNHLVEEALQVATRGDLQPLQQLLTVLENPYQQRSGFERYAQASTTTVPYQTFCGT